jgi:rhodanese-related sulfurtransferase
MGYAGDVDPTKAWEMLAQDPKALLVDVRTEPEWMFTGTPDLSPLGGKATLLSWQIFPAMTVDADFTRKLSGAAADRDTVLLFICRTGGRSRAAAEAMAQFGYQRCFNVSDGFEGPPDPERHRGRVAGWKAAGLPWAQS